MAARQSVQSTATHIFCLYPRPSCPVPGGLSEVRALIKGGDNALQRRNYWGAEEKFQKALGLLANKDDNKAKIPLDPLDGGGVRSESYIKMDFHRRIVLQSCCRGMASALAGLGRDEEVRYMFLIQNTILKQPI